MELNILGKYGPYPKAGGRTSGYLLSDGNEAFAFEMGAGVFSALCELVKPEELSAVIVSHSHFDHISDLGVFDYYLEKLNRDGKLKSKMKLYVPFGFRSGLAEGLKYFDIIPVPSGSIIEIGRMKIEFFEAKHPVPTLGFTAEAGNKKFLYSADTDICPTLKEKMGEANLALVDAAFLSKDYKPNGPHASVKAVAELAALCGTKTILTHFGPENDEKDILAEAGDEPHIILAKEGRSYSI